MVDVRGVCGGWQRGGLSMYWMMAVKAEMRKKQLGREGFQHHISLPQENRQ